MLVTWMVFVDALSVPLTRTFLPSKGFAFSWSSSL